MGMYNPNSFNCSSKKDIANKPFKIGDPTNYFEDPVVCSGFIDVQGIPSRPTDIEITNGDVRIYTGNLLVRPGISTFQEVQIEKELYVCNNVDLMSNLYVDDNTNINGNARVEGTTHLEGNVTTGGDMSIGGFASWSGSIVATTKLFDIEYPSKGGDHRLAHASLEGPELGVYHRGILKDSEFIELPDYWKDLVDTETITVHLTPIGTYQYLYYTVAKNRIIVKNHSNLPTHCSYIIYGERKDGERLIPEYEGNSPEDYPGKNDQYSIAGYHYDRRTL